MRRRGWPKRRTARKVHLAMDANTGKLCATLMTHQDVGDGGVFPICSTKFPPTHRSKPLATMVLTTPSPATRKLIRAALPRQFRHPRARCLGVRARKIGFQTTEVSINVGGLNRMANPARPQSGCIA